MRSKTRVGLLAALALAVAVSIPATAQARTLYGTTSDGKLVTFQDKQTKTKVKPTAKQIAAGKKVKPVKAVKVVARRNIFGLPAGVRIVGIDVRPVTGELYGIGSNSAIYKVIITGDGTAVALFAGSFAGATSNLNGTHFGVDFNPVPDRIRIVSNAGQNLRIDPNGTTAGSTGVPPGATAAPPAVDGALNPGSPSVVGAAYLNSGLNPVKPTATLLYVIDQAQDTLYVQNPPNMGTLTTPVKLSADVGNDVGFDIAGTSNTAYVTNAGSKVTTLYRLDLASGAMTRIGDVSTVNKKGKVKRTTLTGLAASQD